MSSNSNTYQSTQSSLPMHTMSPYLSKEENDRLIKTKKDNEELIKWLESDINKSSFGTCKKNTYRFSF